MKNLKQFIFFTILCALSGCGSKENISDHDYSKEKSLEPTKTTLGSLGSLFVKGMDFVLKSPDILSETEQLKALINIGFPDNINYKSYIIKKPDNALLSLAFVDNELKTKYKNVDEALAEAKAKDVPISWVILQKRKDGRFSLYYNIYQGAYGTFEAIERNGFEGFVKIIWEFYLKRPHKKQLDENGNFIE